MSDEVSASGVGSPSPKYYGTSIGSNPYNPAAEQAQINAILAQVSKGHPLSTAQIMTVMSLAGHYKSDIVGNAAAELAQINKYFAKVQDLAVQLNAAADLSTSSQTATSANPSLQFEADVSALQIALNSPFFKTGAGSGIRDQLGAALTNLLNAACPGSGGNPALTRSALQELWLKTSGSDGVSGDPSQMNLVTQAMGSVQQTYTGVSKSSQATVQQANSEYNAVEASLNAMQQSIASLMMAIIRKSATG